MRILLTNDDGYDAPGLAALAQACAHLGELTVVAPAKAQSAMSHAITLHRPLAVRGPLVTPGLPAHTFSVEGRPADCVKLALANLLPQRPDLVLSGINAGANIGVNVLYSGTTAAAREAAIQGIPAIALSLHLSKARQERWDVAVDYARWALDRLLTRPLTPGDLLNVNLPISDDGAEPTGFEFVPVCTTRTLDAYEPAAAPGAGPGAASAPDMPQSYAVRTGLSFAEPILGTDVEALMQRRITVTPMHWDPTDHPQLDTWRNHLNAY